MANDVMTRRYTEHQSGVFIPSKQTFIDKPIALSIIISVVFGINISIFPSPPKQQPRWKTEGMAIQLPFSVKE
jgi:hypothetical protein